MKRTLRRWSIAGTTGAAISLTLFWNAPRIIDSRYPSVGFFMHCFAAGIWVAMAKGGWKTIDRASRIAKAISIATDNQVSTIDCLDLTHLTDIEIMERLEPYHIDPEAFTSPLNLFEDK